MKWALSQYDGSYERGNLEAGTEVQDEHHVKTEDYNEASTRPGTAETASKLPEARKQPAGVQREYSPTDTVISDLGLQNRDNKLLWFWALYDSSSKNGGTCRALHRHNPITSTIQVVP